MKCEECEEVEAQVLCFECDQALCSQCDEVLHKGGKRKLHVRPKVCRTCRNAAVSECTGCQVSFCDACAGLHAGHTAQALSSPKRIGVFWDIATSKPAGPEAIPGFLEAIHSQLGVPEFVRVYGNHWEHLQQACEQAGFVNVPTQSIKHADSFMLDMSSFGAPLTHVLLISGQVSLLAQHLIQLKRSLGNTAIMASAQAHPLLIETVEAPKAPPVVKNERPVKNYEEVVHLLLEEAAKGNVTHERAELLDLLGVRLGLRPEQAGHLVGEAVKAEKLLKTPRDFKEYGNYEFISLKLNDLTLETLLWALRSLRQDEMLPTEKSIQARLKEAFDLKPSNAQWNSLIQKARGHSHSVSAPVFEARGLRGDEVPRFDIKDMGEPSGGGDVLLVYPKGEHWEALDQHSKFGDFLELKYKPEWEEFIDFITKYFKKSGKPNEAAKNIAGGRYGCAQFLKLCGPPCLRSFSIGKLSYMIQLAISDDILRYQRTFLVFTDDYQTTQGQNQLQEKLMLVQRAIGELLAASREGVPLAQVPYYLKKLLSFPLDINELGFPKLKDLLSTVPNVHIELRGNNQPVAIMHRPIEQISADHLVDSLCRLVKKHSFGISIGQLETLLSEKVNWHYYHVDSLKNFIEKHGSRSLEIIPAGDTFKIFLIGNEPTYFGSAFVEPAYRPMHHPMHTGSIDWPIGYVRGHKQQNVSNIPDLGFGEGSELRPNIPEFIPSSSMDKEPHKGRADSVQFHSHSLSAANTHSRARSEFNAELQKPLEAWDIKPPPGFEGPFFN